MAGPVPALTVVRLPALAVSRWTAPIVCSKMPMTGKICTKLGTEKWSKTRARGEVDAVWALLGGGIHGQIGGNQGEDALSIAQWDRSGDHPDLTAARIKVGGRPDARVCGQWRRDPSLHFDVVGRHSEVEGGIAGGCAIDVGACSDLASSIQQRCRRKRGGPPSRPASAPYTRRHPPVAPRPTLLPRYRGRRPPQPVGPHPAGPPGWARANRLEW